MTTTEHSPTGATTTDDTSSVGSGEGARSEDTSPRRRWVRPDGALTAFCVLALLVGSAFALITPSMWGADEAQHISRVWSISEGTVAPRQVYDARGVNWGDDIPTSVYDLSVWSARTIGDHPATPFAQIKDPAELARLDAAPLDTTMREVAFANTSIYAPVAYLPALAGMIIAKAAGLSVGSAIVLMRLLGLLTYVALVAAGLVVLRAHRARWLVFVAALVPMSLFQATTVTTDTMTLGLCLLAGSLLLKAVFLRARLNVAETTALLVAGAMIPLCKSGYVIFLPLVLVVPSALLPGRRWGRAAAAATVGVGVVAFAWWTRVTAITSSAMGFMRPQSQWGTVVPASQVGFILENPLTIVRIVVNTLSSKGNMYFTQFFGDLGFTFVSIPALATVAVIMATVVAFGASERVSVPMRSTLVVALAVLAGIASVFGALYLGFSPVGYYIIDGVQGRYFLPFILLVLGVLLRVVPLRWHLPDARHQRACTTAVVCLVASALGLAVLKYYFVVWV